MRVGMEATGYQDHASEKAEERPQGCPTSAKADAESRCSFLTSELQPMGLSSRRFFVAEAALFLRCKIGNDGQRRGATGS